MRRFALLVAAFLSTASATKHFRSERPYHTRHVQSESTKANLDPYQNTEAFSESPKMKEMMNLMELHYSMYLKPSLKLKSIKGGMHTCIFGKAAEYPCNNVDLMSFLTHEDMGSKAKAGNDIWGWEDPETGNEYALVGQNDGTAFVDVTDPENPIYKGRLPTHSMNSIWRDIKVYKDHAFIVSEAFRHGVQVFDLTQLREDTKGKVFQESAYFKDTGRCHNIVINEDTGFAYCVGSRDTCNAGLFMIDISDPKNPKRAGCFREDGYVHDAQCVVYNGPDDKYVGREVCFCYNEDTLTIVDVENKEAPKILSRVGYPTAEYTHQGWLTEDQSYLLLDDELDEQRVSKLKGRTTTYLWDVRSLENPVYFANHTSPTTSIDHNLYILGDYAYMTNYASGLRIVDVSQVKDGKTEEWGYFDVRPEDDKVIFQGSWSSYPYFKSGNVIVNSIERGLFVVRPRF